MFRNTRAPSSKGKLRIPNNADSKLKKEGQPLGRRARHGATETAHHCWAMRCDAILQNVHPFSVNIEQARP